ncbi:unnamed protein product [Lampetra fluviatilis]
MASLPPAPEGFPSTVVVEVKVQRSGGVHTYIVTEVAFLNHPRGLIRKGDLILEVNGVPLQHVTPSELGLAVSSSTMLTMDIHREESDQSPRSPRPRSPRRPTTSQGGAPAAVVPFPAVDLSREAVMRCSGWETECLPLHLSLTERQDDAQPGKRKRARSRATPRSRAWTTATASAAGRSCWRRRWRGTARAPWRSSSVGPDFHGDEDAWPRGGLRSLREARLQHGARAGAPHRAQLRRRRIATI